jgi:tetrahydrodipicolinate N-succinyltransferase
MPSFVNIGAYVGEGTMVDTWATVGSCAQIGRNVHISGGTGIGGVLEPLQAGPVIIEDNCFIGARSEVAEGVVVEEGAVISMGVFIGASTKIVDRATGEIFIGRVPAIRWSSRDAAARTARRPEPRLRGDRQARRRPDPVEDRHQRAAAGLSSAARSGRPARWNLDRRSA